jgi:oxalate decarboxylase
VSQGLILLQSRNLSQTVCVFRKSFHFPQNSTAFDDIPASQLYIFKAPLPASVEAQTVKSPYGTIPEPFVWNFSQQESTEHDGGKVKIADSTNFKASKTIAAALVELEPGSIREVRHWLFNWGSAARKKSF